MFRRHPEGILLAALGGSVAARGDGHCAGLVGNDDLVPHCWFSGPLAALSGGGHRNRVLTAGAQSQARQPHHAKSDSRFESCTHARDYQPIATKRTRN